MITTSHLPSERLINTTLLSVLIAISLAFCFWGPVPGVKNTSSLTPVVVAPVSEVAPEVASAIDSIRSAENTAALDSSPSQSESTPSFIVHKITAGQTLSGIWKTYGAPSAGGARAAAALNSVGVTLNSLRVGSTLKLQVVNSDIVRVERTLKNGDEVTLIGNSKDGYKASLKKVQVSLNERTVTGIIQTSFVASARAALVPYEVVDQLVDLFSNQVEFRRELHPGDSFTITYTERRNQENLTELEAGNIARASLTSGGVMYAAIRHESTDGTARYYNAQGEPMGNYFLRYPLQFTRISSVFSNARFHPVLKKARPHNGVDFAAPVGTPVRAIADGIVQQAGMNGGAGIMIRLAHGPRYSTAYLHLSKLAPGVRAGSRVVRGQIIGAVGTTGLSTGPHLHFSLFDRGRYIDPLKASLPDLSPVQERIPPSFLLAALNALKASQDSITVASLGSKNRKA